MPPYAQSARRLEKDGTVVIWQPTGDSICSSPIPSLTGWHLPSAAIGLLFQTLSSGLLRHCANVGQETLLKPGGTGPVDCSACCAACSRRLLW